MRRLFGDKARTRPETEMHTGKSFFLAQNKIIIYNRHTPFQFRKQRQSNGSENEPEEFSHGNTGARLLRSTHTILHYTIDSGSSTTIGINRLKQKWRQTDRWVIA
jgi:hypothetical protein